jgi:hypothetical protein
MGLTAFVGVCAGGETVAHAYDPSILAGLEVVLDLGTVAQLLAYDAGSPFVVDTDGDGTPDALDPCPALAGTEAASQSALPECYFNYNKQPVYIPFKYQQADKGFNAGWNGCRPVMAYRVKHAASAGGVVDGVVIVGVASSATTSPGYAQLQANAKAGVHAWPEGVDAQCLLSINYQDGAIHFLDLPTVATYYTRYSTPIPEEPNFDETEGFGLVVEGPGSEATPDVPIKYGVFGESNAKDFERILFSRGAVYAKSLSAATAGVDYECSPTGSGGGNLPSVDGTHFSPLPKQFCVALPTTSAIFPPPADWSLVPTAVDKALLDDAAARNKALDSGKLAVGAYPFIHALDSELALIAPGDFPWSLSVSRGEVFVASPSKALVVPSEIKRQHQQVLAKTLTEMPPTTAAHYLASPGGTTALAFQEFGLESASRWQQVEAEFDINDNILVAASNRTGGEMGTRWNTSAAPPGCWNRGAGDSDRLVGYPHVSDYGIQVATDWCPSTLHDWAAATPAVNSFAAASAICKPFTEKKEANKSAEEHVPQELKTILESQDFSSGACTSWAALKGLLGAAFAATEDFLCCTASALTLGAACDCNLSNTKQNAIDTANQGLQCLIPRVLEHLASTLPTEQQWPDLGSTVHPLVPMVSLARWDTTLQNFPALRSLENGMTSQDSMLGHSHQNNDWNWKVTDPGAVDPAYRVIASRPDSPEPGDRFLAEHELEFQIPMGKWSENGHLVTDYNLHGKTELDWLKKNAEELGDITPDDSCDLFGIDKNDFGKGDNLSVPTCGGHTNWVPHYGRGVFAPLISESPPYMEGTPPLLGMNFPQKWNLSRVGFLGQPIVDCGHEDYHIELHPPQLITMEAIASVRDGLKTLGTEMVAFGWVNVTILGHLEFDFWPTLPRSADRPQFVALGLNNQLGAPARGGLQDNAEFGYVIDASGPQATGGKPTLQCQALPASFPNHVHCAYDDPSGGPRSPSVTDDHYGNVRMTPYFATSRFEARFFVGWTGQ